MLFLKGISNKIKGEIGFFLATFVLILITHLTSDRLDSIFNILLPQLGDILNRRYFFNQVIPNIKGMIFLSALVFLLLPIIRETYKKFIISLKPRVLVRLLTLSIVICVALFFLHFQWGLRGMGEEYSQVAVDPFRQEASWVNTRILMPFIAHALFFQGYWLYYAFFIILTLTFVAAIVVWCTKTITLSMWEILSICTSSFVYFQFLAPGYPDILVYIFFLLILQDELSQRSKLYLLVLSLFTHEASLFVGLILAWYYLSRKQLLLYLLVIILYFFTWAMLVHNNLLSIISSHNVSGVSGLEWVIQNPLLELEGIVLSYKILWVIIFWAVVRAYKSRAFVDIVFIAAVVSAGLIMSFLGVDTYRLLGFTFPILLLSMKIVMDRPTTNLERNILSILFVINLLIPSFYVGLNTGLVIDSGLYGRFYELCLKLFTGIH